ncbi:MAG: fumarylacetoacetase [Mycobacteriales bacterium]
MSWLWVSPTSDFPVQNLPYGVFGRPGELRRIGVAIGGYVLDVATLSVAGLVGRPEWFVARSLNTFMAAGRTAWSTTRAQLTEILTDPTFRPQVEPHLIPLTDVRMHMPFEVADYVDFYSSLEHATNLGRIFRPRGKPLMSNWRHLPIGYHGRAGTVVPSGTPVVRPSGQRKEADSDQPKFGPAQRLDFEAEVGFVVGVPSPMGTPVPTADFLDHVFGVVLMNDWSARDIQAWEYQPLGPFLSKSFATSISPWVVTMEALEEARVDGPEQDPAPLPYLRRAPRSGLDLTLQVSINGSVISHPPFAGMYWTLDQQLAHLTVNGSNLRTGDLYASGTVSGPAPDQLGSLIEMTVNGAQPLTLPDGSRRTFLEDADIVTIKARAPGLEGARIGFGEVTGQVRRAR